VSSRITAERGDKKRTYRFQDNIVTNHASGKRARVDLVMRGQFDLLG
jgi:protein subunit release factor A